MSNRIVLEPSADHPITIEPTNRRVQVRVNGEVVADTAAALCLQEAVTLQCNIFRWPTWYRIG